MRCRITSRGFTLVELMVVLCLLAILVSIATPSFTSSIRSNRILSAAQEIHGLLLFGRAEAVARKAWVVVEAGDGDSEKWVGNVQVVQPGQALPLRKLGEPGLGEAISAVGSTGSITFGPTGTSGRLDCISICSSDQLGECRKIDVQASGRVVPPKPGSCS